jgi:hypothetical protein
MIITGILALIVFIVELSLYILLIPHPSQQPLKPRPFDKHLGTVAYFTAYILSLLRAPLGLLPYLVKLFIFFALRTDYESSRSTYKREAINMLGDIANLGLSILLVFFLAGVPEISPPTFLLYLPVGAELVRLVAERTPILFSAAWQLFPHRSLAQYGLLRQRSSRLWKIAVRCFPRYFQYFSLDDAGRTSYVLRSLKSRARLDRDISNRLAYIQAYRIVPRRCGLRGGHVRDVANAEVFIHDVWTNDPWLLAGMALRRAPWMFDPRYLRRPFYYMTEANQLATLFVLQHARYSIPYAIFQFGHEIRVSRLHFFYSILRWSGLDIEEKVLADGTFQFDQFIYWLDRRFQHDNTSQEHRYLYTDDEVIADLLKRFAANEPITIQKIAEHYTYPPKYIEEVLWDEIEVARSRQASS